MGYSSLTQYFIYFSSCDLDHLNILSDTETESASEQETSTEIEKYGVGSISTETASESMDISQLYENDDDEAKIVHLHNQIKKLEERLQKQYTEKYKFKEEAALHEKRYQKVEKIFNPDQIDCLGRKNMRGKKWSAPTLTKALKILFTCKSSGYKYLLEKENLPLPALRTLRRKLKALDYHPGILQDVFNMFPSKIATMNETDKYCVLVMDEMSIKPGYDFDMSTQQYIGGITLPGEQGMATHGLVFMLAGLATRWKQIVGFHMTGDSYKGENVKKVLDEILTEAGKIGLKVLAVTSDMGSNNQGVYREYVVGRYANKIDHPNIPGAYLYFLYDPPHVIKCIRNALINGLIIRLPQSVVDMYSLPTDTVDIDYVRMLFEAERNYDWKACPNLTEVHFSPNHWEKMKVNLAAQLIASHSTSVGLYMAIASEEKRFENIDWRATATAWFIGYLNKWFDFMSSRYFSLALSLDNRQKYEETIDFFRSTIELFTTLTVHSKSSLTCTTKIKSKSRDSITEIYPLQEASTSEETTRRRKRKDQLEESKSKKPTASQDKSLEGWKPWQTSVIMSTLSVIELANYLLHCIGFKSLLTARLTQDCIENLFSIVRRGNPNPTCLEFKKGLKIITASQYIGTPSNGNYAVDDGFYICEFLDAKAKTLPKHDKPRLLLDPGPSAKDLNWDKIYGKFESEIFYNYNGYIVYKVLKQLKRNPCIPNQKSCVSKVTASENEMTDCLFTTKKEYNEEKRALTYVSKEVSDLFKKCELIFVQNKRKLFTSGNLYQDLKSIMMEHTEIEGCKTHPLKQLLCSMYASTRLNISIKSLKKNSKPQKIYGIGYRVLADNNIK